MVRGFAGARVAALLLVLGSAAACAPHQDESSVLPSLAQRRQSRLTASEAVVVPADTLLTRVTGLDVDSRGRIYVGDWHLARVVVFSPEGRLLSAIGRRGEGPGEFRSIRGLQVLAADSLLVYDPVLARVSVFAPGAADPAYLTNLAQKLDGPAPFELRRTHGNDGYLALFRPTFQFMPGAPTVRTDVVRLLGLDGARQAELLSFPSKGFLVAGTSVTPHPFGREGIVRQASRDQVFYVWTDSLVVERVGLDGAVASRLRAAYQPPRVSAADAERALGAMPPDVARQFRPVLEDSLPERWPAVRDLITDDRGRLWVALPAAGAPAAEMLAFTPQGRYLASLWVPAAVDIRVVRGDALYGVGESADGVPQVVRFRLSRPLD